MYLMEVEVSEASRDTDDVSDRVESPYFVEMDVLDGHAMDGRFSVGQ